MKKVFCISILILLFISVNLYSQSVNYLKKPKQEHLELAKQVATDFFRDLEEKNHEKLASFIVEKIGYAWDETRKVQEKNDYLNQLEIISLKHPHGVYGDLLGYDLIDEAFLPGSDRFFRHTYITYHEGNYLVWELRFYVGKNEEVQLNYIGWSPNNPFEYMSTPDMLLNTWYR